MKDEVKMKQEAVTEDYLAATEIIDWNHPAIRELAGHLRNGADNPVEIAKRSFEWVRDQVRHSLDFQLNPVTCSASEVLAARTGYCYAKSHLLAALLRANAIPAGMCYQRLLLDINTRTFCLHGLNAVFLPEIGWYRIDPRGNRAGVDAQFTPPVERLAFAIADDGESDLPEIRPDPLPCVARALRRFKTFDTLAENLPDICSD
jgi:transglutaminase-like putative cysteine protease